MEGGAVVGSEAIQESCEGDVYREVKAEVMRVAEWGIFAKGSGIAERWGETCDVCGVPVEARIGPRSARGSELKQHPEREKRQKYSPIDARHTPGAYGAHS